jgi:hypothetical protein
VRFITRDESIRLPQHLADAPLAVPVQLNRKGLSEVVHHLRGGPGDEEAGYDFAIEDQLLRCSLDKFLRATGVSTVRTLGLCCACVWQRWRMHSTVQHSTAQHETCCSIDRSTTHGYLPPYLPNVV